MHFLLQIYWRAAAHHDAMINNQATWTALEACCVPATRVVVHGAGQYTQDLEYPYLLRLPRGFTAGFEVSCESLRVESRVLGKTSYATS